MYKIKAYSAAGATSPLAATTIPRREPTPHDVQIEILFCGICHSDVHSVRNEWSEFMPTVYPIVPGHEIVGRVAKVGSAVTQYKLGDLAAVGCLVDSDGTCPQCKAGFEQFCPHLTLTFNSPDKHLGGVTYGGYSNSIVVDERFVLRVPPQPQARRRRAAPLRWYYHLLTHAPLGCHQGQESRCRWSGGTWPHGRQVRPRVRSPRCRFHHLTPQAGRRAPPRRR